MALRLRKRAPDTELVSLYGVIISLGADTESTMADLRTVLPPVWQPAPAGAQYDLSLRLIAADDGGLDLQQQLPETEPEWLDLDHGSYAEMLDRVRRTLRDFTARNAPEHVFLHAGVVAHNGRAIVVPGESFAGKSTLIAALTRAGALYYSDDFAVLSPDGLVHPFAEPLSLRLVPGRFAQTPHTAEQLGGQIGTEPVPIGLVVAAQYSPGYSWEPQELSPATAVLELITHTYQCTDRPEFSLRTLTAALRGARTLKGVRGEASELAPLLLAELEIGAPDRR